MMEIEWNNFGYFNFFKLHCSTDVHRLVTSIRLNTIRIVVRDLIKLAHIIMTTFIGTTIISAAIALSLFHTVVHV